jgi:hypothetical protein
MTTLLCIAILVGQQGAAQQTANADYLRAAAIVASAGEELKPPKDDNVLEWARNAAKKFGTACDWIRAGNAKPFEPLGGRALNGEFPEFAGYKAIGVLYEARMFEQIADGKPNQAADSLIDALSFGRRVQCIGVIGYMVGSQMIEGNLRMFDLNRRAFAESGLEKLSKLELIQSNPAEKTAMTLELTAYESVSSMEELTDEDKLRALARIEELKQFVSAQLTKEEAQWSWDDKAEAIEHLSPLGISLSITWPRAIVIRTKLRLLNATARVLLEEVRNYKLPDSLTDAYDPATGSSFFYGKRDDAFVIYSLGTEKIGRIELGVLRSGVPQ